MIDKILNKRLSDSDCKAIALSVMEALSTELRAGVRGDTTFRENLKAFIKEVMHEQELVRARMDISANTLRGINPNYVQPRKRRRVRRSSKSAQKRLEVQNGAKD